MNKSDYSFCCDKCFSIIVNEDNLSARLWMDLCKMTLDNNVLSMSYKFFSSLIDCDIEERCPLRTLEIMGFLISIDTPRDVLIKIKKTSIDNEMYFCGGNCEK